MISRDWRCGSTRKTFQGLEVWLNDRGTASRDILEVWLNEGELPGTGGVAQRGRASRDWRCGSTRESFQGHTGGVAQRGRASRDWRCGSTRESFQGLEVWLNELDIATKKDLIKMLVGNK